MKFTNSISASFFNKTNDVKNDSIKGGMWSFIYQIVNFILQIISISILGRILMPVDFGLISIITTFIGFALVFSEVGFSIAIIQLDDLDSTLFNDVFLINLFIGFILFLLFCLVTPLIYFFYEDIRLLYIGLAYSTIFMVTSYSSPFIALLKRTMNFKKIMILQFISTLLGICFGLVFTFFNFGYWTLVLIPISTGIILNILLFFHFKWIPIRYSKDVRIKKIINIGKHMTIFEFVNYFSRNLDNILIGKFFGPYNLGIYSKAYQLLLLPITQIRTPLTNIALPALSQLKNDFLNFRKYYLKFLSIISLLCVFFVFLFYINSYEIISIVLGPNWIQTADIFSILCFAAMLQPLYGSCGLVLLSTERNKIYSKWGFYNSLIIITSFLIGINYNLEYFSIIYVVGNVISYVFAPFYTLKDSPIGIQEYFKKSITILLFFMLVGILIKYYITGIENVYLSLISKTIIYFVFTVLFVIFFFEEKKIFSEILKFFKNGKINF